MLRRARRPGPAAQAVVEAALAFPLLMVLSLGVLQFALYEHARAVLASAVQEGARLAAEEGRGLEDGYARARRLSETGLGASVERVEPDGAASPEVVEMWIDTQLRPILPLPISGGLPIHVRAVVARERFRPGGGA